MQLEPTFYNTDCRYFSGYKPCSFGRACRDCPHYSRPSHRIAILSLEAMGAVLRSTCLLGPLRRAYPNAHVSWITMPESRPLLLENPFIDELICYEPDTLPILYHLEFDLLLAVDKSKLAGALAERLQAKEKRGFGLAPNGGIRAFNKAALYQYDVGLSDKLKFFDNTHPETQQITETMEFAWQRDPYVLALTEEEKLTVQSRRVALQRAGGNNGAGETASPLIGYNTGCSELYPYKKFTLEKAIETIGAWRLRFPEATVCLLGGPQDTARQEAMKKAFAHDPLVVNTPTREGLRSGILWLAATDLVFSGCSLGMHIAVALRRYVVAWFGVSCPQEVDLYEKGEKLLARVGCMPCWKKSCENTPKCFDSVPISEILEATARGFDVVKLKGVSKRTHMDFPPP